MKKSIVVLIAALLLTACACGQKPSGDSNGKTTALPLPPATADAGNTAEFTPPESDSVEHELLDAYYEVPLHEIYIDVPSTYKHYDNAMTEIFREESVKYLSITRNSEITPNSKEEAYSGVFDVFCLCTKKLNPVLNTEFSVDEKVSVNGIEARHYEGRLLCGTESVTGDRFIAGYSFVMDGVAINIAGVTIEKSDDETVNAEIIELVDAMMRSVRTQP